MAKVAREAVVVAHACVHARPVAAGDVATIVSRKRQGSQNAEGSMRRAKQHKPSGSRCTGHRTPSRLDWSQPGRLTSPRAIIQCADDPEAFGMTERIPTAPCQHRTLLMKDVSDEPIPSRRVPVSNAGLSKTWVGLGAPSFKIDALFEMHRKTADAVVRRTTWCWTACIKWRNVRESYSLPASTTIRRFAAGIAPTLLPGRQLNPLQVQRSTRIVMLQPRRPMQLPRCLADTSRAPGCQ